MARALTAEEKAQRDEALKSKTKSKSPSSGSGMKKDVQVKTHTRRTKSGKVTTVKAHTAKREAAKQTPSNGGKSSAKGKELKLQRLQRAEEVFEDENELGVQYLDILTEGTLKYKKEKDSFNTLVNAISALCTKKKGKYSLSDKDAPIESVLMDTRRGCSVDFYKAVCTGVAKRLGASIISAPPGVLKELSRNSDPPVKLNRTKEVKRLSDKFTLYDHVNYRDNFEDYLQEIRKDSAKKQKAQRGLLKIND